MECTQWSNAYISVSVSVCVAVCVRSTKIIRELGLTHIYRRHSGKCVVVHLRFMRSRFTSHFYFILNVLYGIFFYGNKRICRSPEVHIATSLAAATLPTKIRLKLLLPHWLEECWWRRTEMMRWLLEYTSGRSFIFDACVSLRPPRLKLTLTTTTPTTATMQRRKKEKEMNKTEKNEERSYQARKWSCT